MHARRVILLCFAALALVALLDARGLRHRAVTQPAGLTRDVASAVTAPLVRVSAALRLDRPRRAVQDALGRAGVDQIDTNVRLVAAPPRTPARGPRNDLPQPRRAGGGRHRRVFTASRPLRIWVAGDSLAQVPGEALERRAAHGSPLSVLDVESRLDTGLSRPDLYNWFNRIPQAVAQFHPNVAVLSFGADDAHNFMSGVPAGRRIGNLGSRTWIAEYRRRVAGVTRELNAAGVYVVWLGLPITRGSGFQSSFRVVNGILRGTAGSQSPTADFVDTWRLLATDRGAYTDYRRDPRRHLVRIRAGDGVHYTDAGGNLIAGIVVRDLTRRYDLRTTP